MQVASTPLFQDLRLQDLYRYDILDTESEQDFDDLLEAAQAIYGCPMAAITFIDEKRQWIKAGIGIERGDSSLETAFCTHAILDGKVMLVPDASFDQRFHDNPLVLSDPNIRFYAGAPIVSSAGYRLGTVCIMDRSPRIVRLEEFRLLQIISRQISKLLDLRLQHRQLKQQAENLLSVEKQFLRQTLEGIEEERFSIGSALHENIAQGLVATRFYLELAGDAQYGREELIQKSRKHIEEAIGQIRDLAHALVPTTLKEYNLHELLHHLVSRFYNESNIPVALDYKGSKELHPEISLALYRIVEAQLENIRRHSGATEAQVQLEVSGAVQLTVADNGRGIDLEHFQRGRGLQHMLLRAESFGGQVDISARPEGGCRLLVTLPFLQPVAREASSTSRRSAAM